MNTDSPLPVEDSRPLVIHVMYRFDIGGLENGVVNLINAMDPQAYRHAILALTEVTDFKRRVQRDDVSFIALRKPPGQGFWQYPRLFRLFRQLRPSIVHTRNLGAMEVVVPAWLAGVPVRIHGEHGREVSDLRGDNRKNQWMRRLYAPLVTHFFALSHDLADYLRDKVGISADRLTQVYNGVDTARFHPASGPAELLAQCPFDPSRHCIIGTVGRMQPVKDQTCLAHAFVHMLKADPGLRDRARLMLIGEGPLREDCRQILRKAGLEHLAWLPGERSDIPQVLRAMRVFVLPSLAEGISNTILEAMASGLPVIATDVGGNADLVQHGQTGLVIPAAEPDALAAAMRHLLREPESAERMGRAGRVRVLERFSLQAMINNYRARYDLALGRARSVVHA